jgi:hypothetical protein
MKRHPKVHMMKEFDRYRARCGANVDQTRLTDKWQHITCTDCLSAGRRILIGEYFSRNESHG